MGRHACGNRAVGFGENVIVRQACSHQDFVEFETIRQEYEESLPPELRHEEASAAVHDAVFLALAHDEVAGCVAFAQHDAHAGVIKHLYVRPAFRSRGIARALLDALFAKARERGLNSVVLETDPEHLPEAYALYVRLGFAPFEGYAPAHYEGAVFLRRRV